MTEATPERFSTSKAEQLARFLIVSAREDRALIRRAHPSVADDFLNRVRDLPAMLFARPSLPMAARLEPAAVDAPALQEPERHLAGAIAAVRRSEQALVAMQEVLERTQRRSRAGTMMACACAAISLVGVGVAHLRPPAIGPFSATTVPTAAPAEAPEFSGVAKVAVGGPVAVTPFASDRHAPRGTGPTPTPVAPSPSFTQAAVGERPLLADPSPVVTVPALPPEQNLPALDPPDSVALSPTPPAVASSAPPPDAYAQQAVETTSHPETVAAITEQPLPPLDPVVVVPKAEPVHRASPPRRRHVVYRRRPAPPFVQLVESLKRDVRSLFR